MAEERPTFPSPAGRGAAPAPLVLETAPGAPAGPVEPPASEPPRPRGSGGAASRGRPAVSSRRRREARAVWTAAGPARPCCGSSPRPHGRHAPQGVRRCPAVPQGLCPCGKEQEDGQRRCLKILTVKHSRGESAELARHHHLRPGFSQKPVHAPTPAQPPPLKAGWRLKPHAPRGGRLPLRPGCRAGTWGMECFSSGCCGLSLRRQGREGRPSSSVPS